MIAGSISRASFSGACTDHVHDAAPVPPGDLRGDRRAPGAARPGLPGDRDAPDRRRAVAGPCAGNLAPAAGGARGPRAAGRAVRAGDRGRGLADRPVSGAEPAADGPSGRLPGRGLPDRGAAGRADALGALGPDRADLRRAGSPPRTSFATSRPRDGRRRSSPASAPWP